MTSSRDQLIRDRAYAIWEAEGEPAGRDEQHWQQATREIDEAMAAGDAESASVGQEGSSAEAAPSRTRRTKAAPAGKGSEPPVAARTAKAKAETKQAKGKAEKPQAAAGAPAPAPAKRRPKVAQD